MIDANSKELYIPLNTIYGKPNPDGTYTLTALDIKNLNDNLYALAKKIQGGLTFSDMTDGVNKEFSDMNGSILSIKATADGAAVTAASADGKATTAQITANGASATASNALGKAQSVELTVNGLSIENETKSYTIINGDKLKSHNKNDGGTVKIQSGSITLSSDTYGTLLEILPSGALGAFISGASGRTLYLTGNLQIGMYNPVSVDGSQINISSNSTLKLSAGSNMSIDSGGTIYIGASGGYSGDVTIGQAGGTVNLIGDVRVNGVSI